MVAVPPMTPTRMGTQMRMSVINLRAAAKKYPISTRLVTRQEVSTSPATVAARSRSRKLRSRKSKPVLHLVKEVTLPREDRLPPQHNRSRPRARESQDQVINHTRCRLTNTTITCPMRKSKSSALSKLRNEIWSRIKATVITLASL